MRMIYVYMRMYIHLCSRQGPRINLIDLRTVIVTVVRIRGQDMLLVIFAPVYIPSFIIIYIMAVAAKLFCVS